MFNIIKRIFSNSSTKKQNETTASITEQDKELCKPEQPLMSESEKKTVLVFDEKKRIFITKTKYSAVALFCPYKKEFHIRNTDGTLHTIIFNPLDNDEFAYPVAGDWKGTGHDGIGLYYPKIGLAILKNSIDDNNKANISINYAIEGDYIPLAGNWKGNGVDSLCFYYKKKSAFLFPEKDPVIPMLRFGEKGKNYIPICGDWDNSGYDAIGLYEPETSLFRLKNTLKGNKADLIFKFGEKGTVNDCYPVSGNWNGEGSDSIGIYEKNEGVFRLKNHLAENNSDECFKTEFTNLMPLEISLLG